MKRRLVPIAAVVLVAAGVALLPGPAHASSLTDTTYGSTYLAANFPGQGFYGSKSTSNCTNGDPTYAIETAGNNATGGTWNGTAGDCYELTTANNPNQSGQIGILINQPSTVDPGWQLVINGNGSTIYDPALTTRGVTPTSVSGYMAAMPTSVGTCSSTTCTMTFRSGVPGGIAVGEWVTGGNLAQIITVESIVGNVVTLQNRISGCVSSNGHAGTFGAGLSTSTSYDFISLPLTMTFSGGVPSYVQDGMLVSDDGNVFNGGITVSSIVGNVVTLTSGCGSYLTVPVSVQGYRLTTNPLNPILQINDINSGGAVNNLTFPGTGLCVASTGVGCNVVIENVSFVGGSPQSSFDGGVVDQAGIDLASDTDVALDNVQVWNPMGDALELTASGNESGVPNSDVQVNDFIGYNAGRDCLTPGWIDNGTRLNDKQPATIANLSTNTWTNVDCEGSNYRATDWETDENCSAAGWIAVNQFTFSNAVEMDESTQGPVTYGNINGTGNFDFESLGSNSMCTYQSSAAGPVYVSAGVLDGVCHTTGGVITNNTNQTVIVANLNMTSRNGTGCDAPAWKQTASGSLYLN